MEWMVVGIEIFVILAVSFLTGSWQATAIFLAAGMLVVSLLFVFLWRRRERQIEALTRYLMRLQDELAIPELPKYSEGALGTLQSEIYKMVSRLREQSDGAMVQKHYLSDMLSDISHQVKTPLAAITIMTDLLKSPDLSEEKRLEFVANIDRQVNRITWLIRNLLTLSQLEAGVLKLKKEEIHLDELFRKVLEPFELMAEVREVELRTEVPEDILLHVDIHWTAEALSNIVKNCLEHTPAGGHVSISAWQNNFSTAIRIQDDGEGIEKEHLPHIFERFYKADPTAQNSIGIGLAMSQKIILLQNGTITAKSEVGEGTEFLVKLFSEVEL